jgi:hypothetical protein
MASRQPSDLERLLAALTAELGLHQLPFMLIGGQAVLLHGSPRLTEDIDITLGADPDALPVLMKACTALGLKPLPVRVEEFVLETFVLPVRHEATHLRVDFIFSSTAYERQAIARAQQVSIAGALVPFAAPEDLIIHKLFAGRPRDVEDVRGVVRRKGEVLDWSYVERWAREFASVPGREQLPDLVRELRRLEH